MAASPAGAVCAAGEVPPAAVPPSLPTLLDDPVELEVTDADTASEGCADKVAGELVDVVAEGESAAGSDTALSRPPDMDVVAWGAIVKGEGAAKGDAKPFTNGVCATLCTDTGGGFGRISPLAVVIGATGIW